MVECDPYGSRPPSEVRLRADAGGDASGSLPYGGPRHPTLPVASPGRVREPFGRACGGSQPMEVRRHARPVDVSPVCLSHPLGAKYPVHPHPRTHRPRASNTSPAPGRRLFRLRRTALPRRPRPGRHRRASSPPPRAGGLGTVVYTALCTAPYRPPLRGDRADVCSTSATPPARSRRSWRPSAPGWAAGPASAASSPG